VSAATATVYRTRVTHVRTTPLRNAFTYRARWWLVDVDDLPRVPRVLRPFVRFEARDHLGDPSQSLRRNVEHHLAAEGVELTGGRITMLTAPRSLGHAFNPLSVFWCHRDDGTLAATLAEVHNTYGGRHVYTVRTDERGRGSVDKAFYVSPFNPVDGSYTMSLPLPAERLDLTVTLHRAGAAPFVASVRGTGRPAGTAQVVRSVLASPVESVRTLALIRWQGVRLWLRGLPVQPRPTADETPHDHPRPSCPHDTATATTSDARPLTRSTL
jgi:DUF1365 family protein